MPMPVLTGTGRAASAALGTAALITRNVIQGSEVSRQTEASPAYILPSPSWTPKLIHWLRWSSRTGVT